MNAYKVTPAQILLLDKSEEFRNNTIEMAVKVSDHLDNAILLKAVNEEIKRNEGLRLHCFKKLFSWYNEIKDVYAIDEVKCFDQTKKTKEEVETFIDSLCVTQIRLKTAKTPFEVYQIVADDGDYILLRVLHVNMDAYAVVLTLSDLLRVYYSIKNGTELTEKLTSIKGYIENYEKDAERIKAKTKEDNKFFIDYSNTLGEPQYLSCAGGYDGTGSHRVKYSVYKNHPCAYYSDSFDKNISKLCTKYCEDNHINIASIFLAVLEIYYSAVNNGFEDVSMFYTANLRAKLSEKKLPFTTSTALFFRRIINKGLTLRDFIKECDNEYITDLKHWCADISAIMKYLLMVDMLHLNGRYDQIVFTLLPTSFDSLPQGIDVKPYWPKAKEANDFIIYFVLLLNSDGNINVFYRYLEDIVKKEDIIRLSNGVSTILKEGLTNPDIKVSDLMKLVK